MIRTDTEHIFNLQDYEHKTNKHVIYTMLMKKILCFVLLILGIGITFSSCSKQGAGNSSHSDLIGKWKCIEEGNEIDGEYVVETTSSSLVYVFDKTTITAFDEGDESDSYTFEYTLKDNGIFIMGIKWFEILTLNDRLLKIRNTFNSNEESLGVRTFERIR